MAQRLLCALALTATLALHAATVAAQSQGTGDTAAATTATPSPATATPSASASGTPSATSTPSATPSPTATGTSSTGTPTATGTATAASGTPTATSNSTPGATPGASPSPGSTPAPGPASPSDASAATPTPTPTPTPGPFFGAVQAIYNPQRASQAGVQWERLIFPWSLIQKNGPNTWSDGYFTDQQIQDEAGRGIQIEGLAIYTPQWASTRPNNPNPTNVPANLYLPFDNPQNYWGQFMYKLALRYKGLINTWVIWNEPDMQTDQILYTWDGTPTDMYQLVKVASQAVKKANPQAKISLPGLTYWYDKMGNRPLYLARLLEVAAHDPTAAANGDYFDIVDVHQYGNPLNIYATLRTYQRALALYGQDKPIWIGESNIPPYDDPTAPISPAFHATMDQQASYIIQAMALARAGGAQRMSVYKMVDERPEGPGELYGLVRNDGSPRPAFTAYQTAVKWFSNVLSAVYTWDGASDPPTDDQITALLNSNTGRTQWIWPAAVNRVEMEEGNQRVIVVWNASSKPVTAKIPAGAGYAMVVDKFGKDTGEVIAQNGQYTLQLPPSTDNTDPRDPSEYLVGGDPKLLVEKVTPLPTAVDAPIEVVWPRNSSVANVSGVLLQSGSLDSGTYQAVPCRWTPNVRLYASVDGGPTQNLGSGTKRMVTDNGVTYPVWDFNDVNIAAATQGKSIDFWLDVEGVATRAVRWTFTTPSDSNPPPPTWQQEPTVSCS